MKVNLFDFELPEANIALHPCEPRDAARLLQVSRFFFDFTFSQLPDLLNEGDILVFNDSKVIPARLFAEKNGATIELLLHRQHGDQWRCFARPGKKLKVGDVITIADDFEAEILEKHETGEVSVRFNIADTAFWKALTKHGHMPLPPYIRREDTKDDASDYQTIYAKHEGSVAAPTAGLHFTDTLMRRLDEKKIQKAYVTLHVGAGTFQPVKVDDTNDHQMHSEFAMINETTAKQINNARKSGGKVIAVGTTALRILETAAEEDGTLKPFTGDTDIFITPGYRFKIIDRLVTNFHLPKSTLFMLVCAFCGLERMKAAYDYAIASNYRFYSYGDACLLDRMGA